MDDNQNLQEQNQQNRRDLKAEFEDLKKHELRKVVRIAGNGLQSLSEEQREYHTVAKATQENLKINELLNKADSLNLTEADKDDLKLRIRQNDNFKLVNLEKFTGDSKYMTNIKDSVRALDEIYDKEVGDAFERGAMIENAMVAVRVALRQCEAYLKRGKPFFSSHMERYNAVEDTKKRLEEDMRNLEYIKQHTHIENDDVLSAKDTIRTLLNKHEVSSRQVNDKDDRATVVRKLNRNLNGVGGVLFDMKTFEKNISLKVEQSTDRTIYTTSFFIAKMKDKHQDPATSAGIYRALNGTLLDNMSKDKSREETRVQNKLGMIEEYIEDILNYKLEDLDFDNYDNLVTSEKFKNNYLFVKAGWESQELIKYYFNVKSTDTSKKYKFNLPEDKLKEFEARNSMFAVLSSYYDAIVACYTDPELKDVDIDALMKRSFNDIHTDMLQAAQDGKANLCNLYSQVFSMRSHLEAKKHPVIAQYNVHTPISKLLQAERELIFGKYTVLEEKIDALEKKANKDEDKKYDAEKYQLKNELTDALKTNMTGSAVDFDLVPYDHIAKLVKKITKDKIKTDNQSEFGRFVSEELKSYRTNDSIDDRLSEIGKLDEEKNANSLRELCIYTITLTRNDEAKEVTKQSFEAYDTAFLKQFAADKKTILEYKVNRNADEKVKEEVADKCRSILKDTFKRTKEQIDKLHGMPVDVLLSNTRKLMLAFPNVDDKYIEDVFVTKYDKLSKSFDDYEDMEKEKLDALKSGFIEALNKIGEFKDYDLSILPIDVLKQLSEWLKTQYPADEELENGVKNFASDFAKNNDADKIAKRINKLAAKKSKTEKDESSLKEYCIYYLVHGDMSGKYAEEYRAMGEDQLIKLVTNMDNCIKVLNRDISKKPTYIAAKKEISAFLIDCCKLKQEDIDLLPFEDLRQLTKTALSTYPQLPDFESYVSGYKTKLASDILKKEDEREVPGLAAFVTTEEAQKDSIEEVKNREDLIWTLSVLNEKTTDTRESYDRFSTDQLTLICGAKSIIRRVEQIDKDKDTDKELVDKHIGNLAEIITVMLSIDKSLIPTVQKLGFKNLRGLINDIVSGEKESEIIAFTKQITDIDKCFKAISKEITDKQAYTDAKKDLADFMINYCNVKKEDIDLLPFAEIKHLTQRALDIYPDLSTVESYVSSYKTNLTTDILKKEDERTDPGEVAFETSGEVQKDSAEEEKNREDLIWTISVLKDKTTDTRESYDHLPTEQLKNIAGAMSVIRRVEKLEKKASEKEEDLRREEHKELLENIPLEYADSYKDKLKNDNKELIDEYKGDLAAIIAQMFNIDKSKIPAIQELGFANLSGLINDMLNDADKFDVYKSDLAEFVDIAEKSFEKKEEKTTEVELTEEEKKQDEKNRAEGYELKNTKTVQTKSDIFGNDQQLQVLFAPYRSSKRNVEVKTEWTKDEEEAMSLLSGLTFDAELTDEKGLPLAAEKRTQAVLLDKVSILVKLLNEKEEKKPIREGLLKYMTKSEQELMGSVNGVLSDILSRMKEFNKGDWDEKAVRDCLMSKEIEEFLKTKDADITKALEEGEKNFIGHLDLVSESALEGTDDEFLQDDIFKDPVKEKKKKDADVVADKLNKLTDAAYSKQSANGKFLQKALKDYYRYAKPEEKRLMMSYIMKELKPAKSKRESDRRKLGAYYAAMVKGAGPVFQKILQGIPENLISAELGEAIRVVKSELRHISTKYVDRVLDKMVRDSENIKSVKRLNSLGAASIGETFLCEVEYKTGAKQKVVVKILRPDAELHMNNEADFLVKLARDADKTGVMEKSIIDHITKVREELDFGNEAMNAEKGKCYNTKDKETGAVVRSVEINKDIKASKEYLVMDMAEGVTLDRYIADLKKMAKDIWAEFEVKNPKTNRVEHRLMVKDISKFREIQEKVAKAVESAIKRKKHLYKLCEKWCNEALFASFFHHGDLHSGNIMVSDNCATVLDYGNATTFKDKEITPITKMAAAAAAGHIDIYTAAMKEILGLEKITVTKEQEEAFKKKLNEFFKLGDAKEAGRRIYLSLLAAQDCGIPIPRAMNNFSLCEQRLENAVKEMNEAVTDICVLHHDLARMNIANVITEAKLPVTDCMKKIEERRLKQSPMKPGDTIDEFLENMGVVDVKALAKKLDEDEKDTYTKAKFGEINDLKNLVDLYKNNKSKVFDPVIKKIPGWKKKLKELAIRRNKGDATVENELQELRLELSVFQENVLGGYMTYWKVPDISALNNRLFTTGDPEYIDNFFALYEEGMTEIMDMANKYITYMENKHAYFTRQVTKDRYRDEFCEAYAKVMKRKRFASESIAFPKNFLNPNSKSFNEGAVSTMRSLIVSLKPEFLSVDSKGSLLYGEHAERMRQFYQDFEKYSDDVEWQRKQFKENKEFRKSYLYLRYKTDRTGAKIRALFDQYSKLDTAEAKAFKEAYVKFNAVTDAYAKAKFIDENLDDLLIEEYNKASSALWTAYEKLMISELNNMRPLAEMDIRSHFYSFTDILGDEIMNHKTKLLLRVGASIVSVLCPEEDKKKADKKDTKKK